MSNDHDNQDSATIDPYKILFPVGIFSALLSVFLWVFYSAQIISFYPRSSHSNLMFFGFFWSFISGFLMTAVPKMTRTRAATFVEIGASVLLIILQMLLNFLNFIDYSLCVFILQVAAVLFFGVPRILQYGKIPFSGFVFIPVAFLQAAISILIYLGSSAGHFQELKIFWTEALVLNLIFGLGSRLVPVITRVKNAISPDQGTAVNNWPLSFLVLALLNAGYYSEVFYNKEIGIFLRLLAIATVSIFQFKIFSDVVTSGYLGKMIRTSVLCIFLGQLLSIPKLGMNLSGAHVLYVSGLALMTVLIAFRVILAHGKFDINYELSGKKIPLVAALFVGAAIFRFLMKSDLTGSLFWITVLLFTFGLIVWMFKFLKVSYPLKR